MRPKKEERTMPRWASFQLGKVKGRAHVVFLHVFSTPQDPGPHQNKRITVSSEMERACVYKVTSRDVSLVLALVPAFNCFIVPAFMLAPLLGEGRRIKTKLELVAVPTHAT